MTDEGLTTDYLMEFAREQQAMPTTWPWRKVVADCPSCPHEFHGLPCHTSTCLCLSSLDES